MLNDEEEDIQQQQLSSRKKPSSILSESFDSIVCIPLEKGVPPSEGGE